MKRSYGNEPRPNSGSSPRAAPSLNRATVASSAAGGTSIARELGERLAAREPVRVGVAPRERAEAVRAPVAPVEDEPGRDVREREGGRLEVLQRAAEVVVVLRLVDEADAAAVDEQAAGPGALGEDQPVHRLAVDRVAGDRRGRAPPRLAHQAERRAGGHRHAQPVAPGSAPPRGRASARAGSPRELGIALEAARREHDRVRVGQLPHAGARLERDARVEARLDERGEQGPAQRQRPALGAPGELLLVDLAGGELDVGDRRGDVRRVADKLARAVVRVDRLGLERPSPLRPAAGPLARGSRSRRSAARRTGVSRSSRAAVGPASRAKTSSISSFASPRASSRR